MLSVLRFRSVGGLGQSSCRQMALKVIQNMLKAKKTHGFNSCIVISVYPLGIPSITKVTEYRNN